MKTIKYKTIRGLLSQSGQMTIKDERMAGSYQIADYILEVMTK